MQDISSERMPGGRRSVFSEEVVVVVVGGEIEQVMLGGGGGGFDGIRDFLLDGDEVAGGEVGRLRTETQQET